MAFFALAYLAVTIGELCLSPIGLSIMTKLSPHRLVGVMMGTWFWQVPLDSTVQV
jgi:POT family proton-dependent oligopeptide transporter